MWQSLLRKLVSAASVSARRIRATPNALLLARFHAQASPSTFSPCLWDDCGSSKKHCRRCPKLPGACCRGQKYQPHPSKPLDYRPIPCCKMCKCPLYIEQQDRCDPWRGTRRSKKARFMRRMAKKYPMRKAWRAKHK